MNKRIFLVGILLSFFTLNASAKVDLSILKNAYPDVIQAVSNDEIIWFDGSQPFKPHSFGMTIDINAF